MNERNFPVRRNPLIPIAIVVIVLALLAAGAFLVVGDPPGAAAYVLPAPVAIEGLFVDINGDGLVDYVIYAEVFVNDGGSIGINPTGGQ